MKVVFLFFISFPFGTSSLFDSISVGWDQIPKIFFSPATSEQKLFERVFVNFPPGDKLKASYSQLFSKYNNQSPAVDFSLIGELLQPKSTLANVTSVEELKYQFLEWILIFRELLKLSVHLYQNKDSIQPINKNFMDSILQKFLDKVNTEISLAKVDNTWVWWDHCLENSKYFAVKKQLIKIPPQEKKKISILKIKRYRNLQKEGSILYPLEIFQWKSKYKLSHKFPWLSVHQKDRKIQHYAVLGDCTWIPFGQLWHNVRLGWIVFELIETRLSGQIPRVKPFFYSELKEVQNFTSLFKEIKRIENDIAGKGVPFIKIKDILGDIPDFMVSVVDSLVTTETIRSFLVMGDDVESILSIFKVFLRILLDRVELFLDVRDIDSGILNEKSISEGAFSF